ncbi:hypothetical protein THARTR1_06879 [Trichoderma harzianum]|uniref:Uncharacterized protein n=1 Tax=Trichoderma harzianum TaxID=5544 RepID=A0A2K0U409_TRIHA|nr:hypothetical protein THARTR1_06879 [Trichoderma harzianum]
MAPHATLQKTIEKKGGKKAASDNAKAALLQMPVELICKFANVLPSVDKMVFAETCRPIHNSIGVTSFSKEEGESREEKFEYLARRSRETPNQWVCEECMCQHDIDPADTPASPVINCPVGNLYASRYNLSLKLIARENYWLGRRHVQLALKYTRLYNEISAGHRQYLTRLMATRIYSESHVFDGMPLYLAARITPRIVEGRFFLKSVFEVRQKSGPIDKKLLIGDHICPHQTFWTVEVTGESSISQFTMAVDDAFNKRGHEVCSYCPYCCTDFSVEVSRRSLKITIWNDLGTESSALDIVWLASVPNPTMASSDLVNEAPGRVKAWYDSVKKEVAA